MSETRQPGPAGAGPTAPPGPLDKGLRAGALGLVAATVIGVASTAPAYSLASGLGPLAATTGTSAPLILLLAAVPMLLMAIAFAELNRIEPDCGTAFAWVSRALGPRLGWLAGWGMIVPSVLVMSNLAHIASVYSFRAVGLPGLAETRWAQLVLGCAWLVLLTWVCYRGIRTTARLQAALLVVEAALLVAFAAVAMWRVSRGELLDGAPGFTADFFTLGSGGVVAGFMVAVFLYWGWDSAVSVNEESRDPKRTPGRAAVTSLAVVALAYAVVAVGAFAFAGPGRLADGGNDVFGAVASSLWGQLGAGALVLAVLVSAVASAQTTILPAARSILAMGTYGALPTKYGAIHPRYRTPSRATIVMGAASIAVFIPTVAISRDVLTDLVNATALTITFYYALTGLACPLYFRRALKGTRNLLMRGILPALGGLVMAAAFVRTVYDLATLPPAAGSPLGIGLPLWLGVGSLLLGVLVMLHRQRRAPDFFRGGKLAGPGDTVADGLARVE